MELRHLRYFVAVAEAGSLKQAAETLLNTAQPSLSRQIRDLEGELGVTLLTRSVRGTRLTVAGQAFLEQARLSLQYADAAAQAARRAAAPVKTIFAVGFLTGQEVAWLPQATRLISDELPKIEVRVSSGFSTNLADDLLRRRIDIAFLRREPEPDLHYKLVAQERLVAIMPADHRLAVRKSVSARDVADGIFIGISPIPRVLRGAVMAYFAQSGVAIVPHLEIDNFAMAISLVLSERGVALLPVSVEDYLPSSVVSRRLKGPSQTVDLVVGYHKANSSPILKMFLSRIEGLNPII